MEFLSGIIVGVIATIAFVLLSGSDSNESPYKYDDLNGC